MAAGPVLGRVGPGGVVGVREQVAPGVVVGVGGEVEVPVALAPVPPGPAALVEVVQAYLFAVAIRRNIVEVSQNFTLDHRVCLPAGQSHAGRVRRAVGQGVQGSFFHPISLRLIPLIQLHMPRSRPIQRPRHRPHRHPHLAPVQPLRLRHPHPPRHHPLLRGREHQALLQPAHGGHRRPEAHLPRGPPGRAGVGVLEERWGVGGEVAGGGGGHIILGGGVAGGIGEHLHLVHPPPRFLLLLALHHHLPHLRPPAPPDAAHPVPLEALPALAGIPLELVGADGILVTR
mmetsp:Transcript_56790/g.151527  ORF Transcript_56790/g.151527 Transcript_56790/m.151527 type:complete len:287 (-) Transcript_56790:1579-2439(-)